MIEHYLKCSKCSVFFEIHNISHVIISYIDEGEPEPREIYLCSACRGRINIK